MNKNDPFYFYSKQIKKTFKIYRNLNEAFSKNILEKTKAGNI